MAIEEYNAADADDLDAQPMDGAEDGGDFVTATRPPANRSTMLLVGLMLVGACTVYFLYLRTGPASAEAASQADAQAASQTINHFLTAGGENIRLMERLLRGTEKVVQQFKTYPSATQVPLSDLKTNPFRYELPRPEGAAPSDEALLRQRAQERQEILAAVQGLQLTMIMHGEARPACIINNTMYGEGQQVDRFTIDRISSDSVIVKSGPYRFELKMQR